MSDMLDPENLPSIESTGGRAEFAEMADGVRIRIARFPAPVGNPAGTVLMFPGFTEFIEKALESVAAFQARGYEVVTLDWRGQGLSDRLTEHRHKGHIADMAHFLNDLEEVLQLTRFRDLPKPHILFGHSMGGHLALRAAHDHGDLFSRLVLCAPMAGVLSGAWPHTIAYGLSKMATGFGLGHHFVPGAAPYRAALRRFDNNPLTSDPVRFERIHAHIDANPDLALGGPTYGWVYSAFRSMRFVNRPAYLSRITAPVLLLSAGQERIVSNSAQRKVADLLPECRLVNFPEGHHELMLERDEIRLAVWEEIDRFLAEGRGNTT